MLHGITTEPEARDAYAFITCNNVQVVGIVKHPSIHRSHSSPDGLIDNDGLLEIKCPQSPAHIDYLLSGKVPDKYIVQMLWQMACTGRKWCDFASYDPRMPPELQLFIKRVVRDDKRIAELEGEVVKFLEEVDETVKKLNALKLLEAA
jgi:hypothetical protein